jgi:hypothetical protein
MFGNAPAKLFLVRQVEHLDAIDIIRGFSLGVAAVVQIRIFWIPSGDYGDGKY